MNTNMGRMAELSEELGEQLSKDPELPVFRVGERITIRGGHFKVQKITRKGIVLRATKELK